MSSADHSKSSSHNKSGSNFQTYKFKSSNERSEDDKKKDLADDDNFSDKIANELAKSHY